MFRKFKTYIEYTGAFLLIILLLMAISGVILTKFYGEDIKRLALSEINNRIDTRIEVRKMEVSFFQKFPYITIVLDDATVWSGRNFSKLHFPGVECDTLFHAQTIYFRFSPLSLINKHYKIGKIQADEGFVNIFTDGSGRNNYSLLKESGAEASPLFLDLKKVELNTFAIRYISILDKVDFYGTINELSFNGKFSAQNYSLLAQTRVRVDHFISGSSSYLSRQQLKARLGIAVTDSLYRITAGTIQLDDLSLVAGGQFIVHKNGSVSLDLVQSAENVDLAKVVSILPEDVMSNYKNLTIRGSMSINSSVKGTVSAGVSPSIDAQFGLKKGFIRFPSAPYPVEQIRMEGRLSNNPGRQGELRLTVEPISFESAGDRVEGELNYLSGKQKQFYGKLAGTIESGNLPAWYPTLPIEKCSGPVNFNIAYSGLYPEAEGSPLELYLDGNLDFEKLDLEFPWYKEAFRDLQGSVAIKGSEMQADLDGRTGKSDFHFNGTVGNLTSYLASDDALLLLEGRLTGKSLYVDELIDSYRSNGDEEDSTVHLPGHIAARIFFDAENLYYSSLSATTISGSAHYGDRILTVDHFTMNSMGGLISGRAALGQLDDQSFRLDLNASFDKIDIESMFLSFNNFGQDFITDQHLKGRVSGTGILSVPLTSGFTFQERLLKCDSKIVITSGELLGFEPLKALSSFIDLEELSDITFSRLENNILISDGVVYIPEMNVSNSAINLTAAGEHTFDNLYEYRIRLKLSDLLYNKARKDKELGIETVSDEGDQRTLFLRIYDQGPGMKVEYDRKQAAEKIRNDLKEEKQELKVLFNEEFGLFRNNDAVKEKKSVEPKAEPLFRFEFEDETNPDSVALKKSGKKDRKRNTEPKTKPDFEIVIDDK